MPRVTLAYAWDGKKPDATVDVDEATAFDLIEKGWARPADADAKKGGK
jgi:hypothetical protein